MNPRAALILVPFAAILIAACGDTPVIPPVIPPVEISPEPVVADRADPPPPVDPLREEKEAVATASSKARRLGFAHCVPEVVDVASDGPVDTSVAAWAAWPEAHGVCQIGMRPDLDDPAGGEATTTTTTAPPPPVAEPWTPTVDDDGAVTCSYTSDGTPGTGGDGTTYTFQTGYHEAVALGPDYCS